MSQNKNNKTRFIKLVLTTAAFVSVGIMWGQKVNAEAKSDTLTSLPKKEELFGFDGYVVRSESKTKVKGSDVSAYRKSDKSRLWVVSLVAETEAEAKQWVQRRIITNLGPGPMPSGSPSGQKIGDECYNSNRNQGLPSGALTMIARDGRAVVMVQLSLPPRKEAKRIAVPTLSDKDVVLVEQHTSKVLAKLSKMGYASEPK